MPRAWACVDERLEVVERAVARMDVPVVGDVVAVVLERRREERQQPEAGDAEVLQVIELARQAAEVADAVVVAVEERLDVRFVDDRVLVPERIVGERHGRLRPRHQAGSRRRLATSGRRRPLAASCVRLLVAGTDRLRLGHHLGPGTFRTVCPVGFGVGCAASACAHGACASAGSSAWPASRPRPTSRSPTRGTMHTSLKRATERPAVG